MTTTATSSSFDSTLTNLGITRSKAANAATVTTNAAANTLTQADFLQLMTAQMKNQDPFNPVDNTQMVAQMAQFSSLAGISEMSSTLKTISDKLATGTSSDALGYVGKTVLTEGNVAYGRSTGGIAGSVELGADASNVIVTISDADGQPLRTLTLGKQAQGTVNYDWDGKTEAGVDAGTGPFKIAVTAQDSGTTVSATSLVWAPVQSVSVGSNGPVLTLPGIGTVAASKVRQIG